MSVKRRMHRMIALLLCMVILLGNAFDIYAAQEPVETAAEMENIGESKEEEKEETEAEEKKFGKLLLMYQDMYGQAGEHLFEAAAPKEAAEGENLEISVNYLGSFGWTAEIFTDTENLDYELTAEKISFVMPPADVTICLKELEAYDQGNLSGEDSALGEDIGKKHDVTTSKEYEPDILLGKSARWENIEQGLAELTLTEKDTSDWSDNPSDYMIILDRTRTMAIDDNCFWAEESDAITAAHSVCLNPEHRYYYRNQAVRLIDYKNGYRLDNGESVHLSDYSSVQLWNYHYNASQQKIRPSISNGCYDRLTLAQKSIRDILDVLHKQNQEQLAQGLKNRVMYWSFSGPTYADKKLHPDGLWNEVPEFTEDIEAAKDKIQYQTYAGTYYNNSFERILKKLEEKKKDPLYKDIPTKVIFISDGLQSDADKAYTAELASKIKAEPNTKIYTILIGNDASSEAGRLMESYASSSSCFATVNREWNTFVSTITAIQQDQFEIGAVEKVLTDKIDNRYWEIIGEPIVEAGNGTAKLDSKSSVLTWNIPAGEGKTYTCRLKLKLKEKYRYLLSDTSYPTNLDADGADDEAISKEPEKAGAVLDYQIKGGKYHTESRQVGIKTASLKYGTVKVTGTKYWTVDGSCPDSLKISLKRIMPGSTKGAEINNTITNVTRKWKYSFDVRQMPDGSRYPLIKYNNAGQEITYEVSEVLPEYFTQVYQTAEKTESILTSDLYNEPYKQKARLEKEDQETGNPLSGAEFTVYTWSKKAKGYVTYHGTTATGEAPYETGSMNGSKEPVKMQETEKGIYITPVWLYYSEDNEGKFRIIETKAPEGYFGDWTTGTKTETDADKNVYDLLITKDPGQNKQTISIANTEEGTFTNQRALARVEISKNDLEAQDKTPQGNATLIGAEYGFYAEKKIVHQDGTTGTLFEKDEEIPLRLIGTQDGSRTYCYDPQGKDSLVIDSANHIMIEGLELGSYYLKEKKASEGYLINPEKCLVDLTYQDEKTKLVELTDHKVYEQVKKQKLTFYKVTGTDKTDRMDLLKGAKFSIYLISELCEGKYADLTDEELVQKIIDDFRDPYSLDYHAFCKISPAVVYDEKDSSDVISKKLTKKVTYADGTSWDAPKQENAYLVAELESDSKGIVQTPSLPYGRYLVVETTVPKNVTATRPFVINVKGDDEDLSTEGDGLGKKLEDLVILMDKPVKALLKIKKTDSQSKDPVLKEGAAYLIHDIEGAWFNYITAEMTTEQKNAYRESYADLVVQYSQGTYYGTTEAPYVTKKLLSEKDDTDNVYVETPLELPSGMYELEEIAAPEGYILQGCEGIISKKESASGNGTFYETEEEGKWTAVPQGRTRFLISSSEAVYDSAIGAFVISVSQQNTPAIGKISVDVQGACLTLAKQEGRTLLDRLGDKLKELFGMKRADIFEMSEKELSEYQDYAFHYEMRPIEGASFEIRAAQDIYSPEGGANAKKLFEKDSLVTTLTSDAMGQTWTGQEDWEGTNLAKGLPLGKYYVIQTKTAEGFCLSEESKKPREIEIAYAGQEVPVIYRDTSYENPAQKVTIEISKKDAETKAELVGAVFGLYTAEEIKNYQGKTIVKEDTLIATAETLNKDGKAVHAVFEPELPSGQYYVKELKAPSGYLRSDEIIRIDAAYAGQEKTELKLQYEFCNEKAPEEPKTPVPETPERYDAPEQKKEGTAPKTGDPSSMALWLLAMSAAMGICWFLKKMRKKQ